MFDVDRLAAVNLSIKAHPDFRTPDQLNYYTFGMLVT
jgi:hypothetical protein